MEFEIGEIVLLLGIAQCLYISVYIAFRMRYFSLEILPLAYFVVLALALFLDLAARFIGSGFECYLLLQWGFWYVIPPLSVLLIIQVASITKPPSPRHFLVLLLIPLALAISWIMAGAESECQDGILGCRPFKDWLVVTGVIAGALSLLEIWVSRDLLNNVRIQKNGKERYWLIITLDIMAVSFLVLELFGLGQVIAAGDAQMIRGILGISLAYIASTVLLRLYPQTIRSGGKGNGEDFLNNEEIELAMRIEHLFELDKVYQEPAYSRADLAKELNVSETIVSRVINLHFQKSFPQIINEHRVEDAKRMLAQTDAAMTTVAEETGFNSIATFNRVFKDVTGVSPSDYRKAG